MILYNLEFSSLEARSVAFYITSLSVESNYISTYFFNKTSCDKHAGANTALKQKRENFIAISVLLKKIPLKVLQV